MRPSCEGSALPAHAATRLPGTAPDIEVLWAKSDRDGGPPVSLVDHCRAAGLAAAELLRGPLTPVVAILAAGLGVAEDDAVRVASTLVALHDLGKATPAFQAVWPDGVRRVAAAGYPFGQGIAGFPHAEVSTGELGRWLQAEGVRPPVARRLARAVGAHHGVFPRLEPPVAVDGADPAGMWPAARSRIIATAVAEFAGGRLPVVRDADDAAVAVLAGLTTFADWLASDRGVLGGVAAGGLASTHVADVLGRVPLDDPPRPPRRAFAELFEFPPRGAQVVVDTLIAPLIEPGAPTLTVIEDATGAGKTEAAFLLVHAALAAGARGAYVALPSRATSDQAYGRLVRFLGASVSGVNQAHLLHSSALLRSDYAAVRSGTHALSPHDVGDPAADGAGAVEAAEWFCRSKRGLLASFAVGTVDQAMLAVLTTRFATLRLLGLAGKTLVLDEVHAYDSYMLAVIERLVAWAGEVGSHVVLLSATLPADMKRRLMAAFGGGHAVLAAEDAAAYPSVTHVARGGAPRTIAVEAAAQSRRRVGIERLVMPDPEEPGAVSASVVAAAVRSGANVAVVLNTVRRAQAVYTAVAEAVGVDRVVLLHSRFRMREREERERAVLAAFGRTGDRPRGRVVVATQVIEQSLDLDFDLLVSDLAPVDLLLQRIGRLQRHDRRGQRPPGYDEDACRLVLLEPPTAAGVPATDRGTARVYEPRALLRTSLALAGRAHIDVPDDVRGLVEGVYDQRDPPGDLSEEAARAWRETRAAAEARLAREETMAGNRVIGSPGSETLTSDLAQAVGDGDGPAVGGPAQTRLGVSCPVVVLRSDEAARLASSDPAVPRVARALIERSLSISDPGLVRELVRTPVPAHWRRAPLVSHHRLVVLDSGLTARVGDAHLRLHDRQGLVIAWQTA